MHKFVDRANWNMLPRKPHRALMLSETLTILEIK
jgi:hypothetical protein